MHLKKSWHNRSIYNTKKAILKQSELGKVRFGVFGNASKNACGVICLHNLKVILGTQTCFSKDYKNASRWGTNLYLGVFGTNPLYVNIKLSKLRILKKMFMVPKIDRLDSIFSQYDIVILAYSWGGIMDMHYATFQKNTDGTIKGYNTSQRRTYVNVNQLIMREPIKKVLFAWGINKTI